MGSNKGGNQLRDALLAAGIKSASKPAGQQPLERKILSAHTGQDSPIHTPPLDIHDLPAAWHSDRPAVPAEHTEPRGSRNRPQTGLATGKSSGQSGAGNRQANVNSRTTAQPMRAPPSIPLTVEPPRLVKQGAFRPHPLLDPNEDEICALPMLGRIGNERQIAVNPSDATEFVIGLDFGTSMTKVVLRDSYRKLAFPVRFRPGAAGIDAFLLPSSLYRSGDTWSLAGGDERIRDLKLRLLQVPDDDPVDEFNDCCAYLALVIRRCRGWLFTEHGKEYSSHQIEWRLNLGIAARSYEDERTVSRFRRLAWAAANVAAQPATEIDHDTVDEFRVRSMIAPASQTDLDGIEFHFDQIDVVPEISAQLQGFMRGARWDWRNRPIMMLVDVGAGTVDTALFGVTIPEANSPVLNFFSNRVEQNGVINLHRARVGWLERAARAGAAEVEVRNYLAAQRVPTDRQRPIPESVREYVPGYAIECAGLDVDGTFMKENYRRQVAGCIQDARVGKGLNSKILNGMPLLLCGGGSRMRYFSPITEIINATQGWSFKAERLSMPVPDELADFGMNASEFDRISVAYGLSQVGLGNESIGKIVRATDVPPMRPLDSVAEQDRPEAISKDHM